MGSLTRNAIAAFQKDNQLKVSRFVDRATWVKLNELVTAGVILTSGELNMLAVQKALKKAGLDPGPVDGKAGRRTNEAILEFQKNSGLKPDGKIGVKTLRGLAEYLSTP